MLNCFGPVQSGENIIGSVRGRGHKIYYFSVRSGSGQKITGQYLFGVPKTLPRRTLVYIDRTTLHVRFQFFPKSCFWPALFFVFKNPHWLTVGKVFGTQLNSLQLLFFWKHDLFINHFLIPLYHLDGPGFCFVCLPKHQCIWYVFTQINSWHGVHEMGILVLSKIFCIFSRNTKLPNFVNIFREKYSSDFYKQGVIWKVI